MVKKKHKKKLKPLIIWLKIFFNNRYVTDVQCIVSVYSAKHNLEEGDGLKSRTSRHDPRGELNDTPSVDVNKVL